MRLTCHYPGNEHTHVGTQRPSPEQAEGTVGFPTTEINKKKQAPILLERLQVG